MKCHMYHADPELEVLQGLRLGHSHIISMVSSAAALRRIVNDERVAGFWTCRIVQRSAAVEEELLPFSAHLSILTRVGGFEDREFES